MKYQNIMEKEDFYKKRLETEKLKLELQKQAKMLILKNFCAVLNF